MENDKRRNTIIAVALVVALAVILIVAWIINRINKQGETGGVKTSDGVVITTDVSEITKIGFPEKLYSDFAENFFDAMIVINPTCDKVAKAKNLKNDSDDYTFDIVRCNVTYNVELSEDGKNYSFIISKNGENLINYNSASKGRTYLSADTIWKFLPMNSKTNDGLEYTIKQENKNNPKELTIYANTCSSQDKQNKALEAAKERLEYTRFNPEDFTFIMQGYCDGEN